MRKHRVPMIALGLAVSAVFVWLALRGIQLDAVVEAFRHADLFPWLPLGVVANVLGHTARGVRLRLLVRRHAQLTVPTATNIVVAGYAANNVLPARLGELVRAALLAQRARIPVAQSLAITFIERVLDGLVLLLLLVLATSSRQVEGWIAHLVTVAVIVFGVATVVMVAAAIAPSWLTALASRVGGVFGARVQRLATGLARGVVQAGASLRDPRDAAKLAVVSILAWCCDAGLYILILPVFGIPFSIELGVITMCVTGFSMLLPSSPGAIGPFHYFASRVVAAFGVAHATAMAYATLVHLAFYVPITLWGIGALLWYGVRLGAGTAAPPAPVHSALEPASTEA